MDLNITDNAYNTYRFLKFILPNSFVYNFKNEYGSNSQFDFHITVLNEKTITLVWNAYFKFDKDFVVKGKHNTLFNKELFNFCDKKYLQVIKLLHNAVDIKSHVRFNPDKNYIYNVEGEKIKLPINLGFSYTNIDIPIWYHLSVSSKPYHLYHPAKFTHSDNNTGFQKGYALSDENLFNLTKNNPELKKIIEFEKSIVQFWHFDENSFDLNKSFHLNKYDGVCIFGELEVKVL